MTGKKQNWRIHLLPNSGRQVTKMVRVQIYFCRLMSSRSRPYTKFGVISVDLIVSSVQAWIMCLEQTASVTA